MGVLEVGNQLFLGALQPLVELDAFVAGIELAQLGFGLLYGVLERLLAPLGLGLLELLLEPGLLGLILVGEGLPDMGNPKLQLGLNGLAVSAVHLDGAGCWKAEFLVAHCLLTPAFLRLFWMRAETMRGILVSGARLSSSQVAA